MSPRVSIAIYLLCVLVGATCARRSDDVSGATRIVSVGGPVTETVFALGEGPHVIAVDSSSVYPPSAASLPQIGYQRTLSAEPILALSPDLVIVSSDAGPSAALAQLRAAGVAVAVMPPADSIASAAARVEAVGAALHVSSTALAAQVRAASPAAPLNLKAVAIYARGAGTLMLAGDDTTAAAMLRLSGATNAATGFSGYKPFSAESLIAAAPDAIVVPSRGLASLGGVAGVLALPGVRETPAGRARRIIAIDDLLLLGFGPRLPLAISELHAHLRSHPTSTTIDPQPLEITDRR